MPRWKVEVVDQEDPVHEERSPRQGAVEAGVPLAGDEPGSRRHREVTDAVRDEKHGWDRTYEEAGEVLPIPEQ